MEPIKVEIPREGLLMTIEVCKKELAETNKKYQTNTFGIILRILREELNFYFKAAFIGLVVALLLGILKINEATNVIVVYLIFLACMACYEQYRMSYYQMEELLSPVLLNKGVLFLYKTISISLCQLILSILLCLIMTIFTTVDYANVILFALIPIYVSQVIMLMFKKYIQNQITVLILFVLLVGVMIFLNDYYFVRYQISALKALALFIGILSIYIIELVVVYKKGGSIYGVNTYEY